MDIVFSDVEVEAVISEAEGTTPTALAAKKAAISDMAGVDFDASRLHYQQQLDQLPPLRILASV